MVELKDDVLYRDGRVVPSDTHLTDIELDQLIKQFDPTIRSTREWSKKQSSWSGIPWSSMDWFVESNIDWSEYGSCDVSDKVYAAGGTRLLTLYCNKFNFFSAAQDLGIQYAAMVKWFQRWRKQAHEKGITPETLGLNFTKTTPLG